MTDDEPTELPSEFLPASRLVPIASELDEAVPVRRSEIADLAQQARGLRNGKEPAKEWASIWLGIGISAMLTLVALLGVEGQHLKDWVISGEVALMVASYFLAVLCWCINGLANRQESSNSEKLAQSIEMLSDRATGEAGSGAQ
jgi:hypothetical protein